MRSQGDGVSWNPSLDHSGVAGIGEETLLPVWLSRWEP